MIWIEQPAPPGLSVPPWMLHVGVEGTRIFVPAVSPDVVQRYKLAAVWEGLPVVVADAALYVPLDWLRREFPDTSELCNAIEQGVRDHLFPDETTPPF